jgi:mRNA-degrading endonuclease HigB of HigAB toxin-antitoxin module
MRGNYRLITTAAFTVRRICIKARPTHREYERKEWMKSV